MALAYTQYPADTFETLQINAGVVCSEFDTSTGTLDRTKILGATTGGINFTATPSFADFGEDVDNVPNNTKELKVLEYFDVKVTCTFVTASTALAKRLATAADVSGNKVAPRADLTDADFDDIWFVGDYGDRSGNGGFIAIKLIDALSTGGFQLQTGKNNKGQLSAEWTGHYSIADADRTPPFEIWIKPGTAQQGGGGH